MREEVSYRDSAASEYFFNFLFLGICISWGRSPSHGNTLNKVSVSQCKCVSKSDISPSIIIKVIELRYQDAESVTSL